MKTAKGTPILLLLLLAGGALMASDEEIIGYVGDDAITRADVSQLVSRQLFQVRQQEYDILSKGFDQLVNERLAAQKAQARGITVEELMRVEVQEKVQDPSEEAIDQFYASNKSRMGGRTREQAGPDIGKYLRQVEQGKLQAQLYDGLRSVSSVRVVLDPPRVEVPISEGDPARGAEGAAVVMVEFSDFQCPYCRRAHPTVERILDEYGDRIRFVYRDYPLPNHPRALPAANAARCAGEQERYWEYHQNLMSAGGDLSDEDLESRAEALELDLDEFKSCVASNRHAEAVRAGLQDGAEIGVSGTPAFFINGRLLSGAQPYEAFKKILDDELARTAASGEATSGAD